MSDNRGMPRSSARRRLMTVLFLDIVGSTALAHELGDARWRVVLTNFRSAVRHELKRYGGREQGTEGDSFFATFAEPVQALRAAAAIVAAVQDIGLDVRSGAHTGEVEELDHTLGGIAVHIGARVCALAGPAEVMVTSTVKELVALIRSGTAKYSFASPGTGTPPHLIGEYFRQSLGLDLVHVPFNSAGLAVSSTLAGHTPIAFTSLPPAVPQIKEGKLRALAVTSKVRTHALPDVPSMTEAGYPDIEGQGWLAFIVPAGTPGEIITLLHREIVKTIALPDIQERFAALGFDAVGNTPAEAAAMFRTESAKWGKVIREAAIRAQ